jgi:hypothetical protein
MFASMHEAGSSRLPSRVSYDEAQRRWGAELEQRLGESVSATGLVGEMLNYQLASRGKRLRALLPVWGAANLGGCPEDALDVGVGLELLHNATLVHDDLQDGDRYRRGVATVWHRWGAPQAINAGNALVFESFARIGRAPAGARVMRTVSHLMLRDRGAGDGVPAPAAGGRSGGDPADDRRLRGRVGAARGVLGMAEAR